MKWLLTVVLLVVPVVAEAACRNNVSVKRNVVRRVNKQLVNRFDENVIAQRVIDRLQGRRVDDTQFFANPNPFLGFPDERQQQQQQQQQEQENKVDKLEKDFQELKGLLQQFIETQTKNQSSGGAVPAPVPEPDPFQASALQANCASCHGLNKSAPAGNLYFDRGHKLSEEVITRAIRAVETGAMPQEKTLDPATIKAIKEELLSLKF